MVKTSPSAFKSFTSGITPGVGAAITGGLAASGITSAMVFLQGRRQRNLTEELDQLKTFYDKIKENLAVKNGFIYRKLKYQNSIYDNVLRIIRVDEQYDKLDKYLKYLIPEEDNVRASVKEINEIKQKTERLKRGIPEPTPKIKKEKKGKGIPKIETQYSSDTNKNEAIGGLLSEELENEIKPKNSIFKIRGASKKPTAVPSNTVVPPKSPEAEVIGMGKLFG
jgi:hypothetical protein